MNGSSKRPYRRPPTRRRGGQAAPAASAQPALSQEEHVSLCETLDRVLNKGVVIGGEIIISVAEIDLVYLGLQAILTSVETANRLRAEAFNSARGPSPLREG